MGLTRGASSAAANSPPNKKVKKVYNTNEQYDPTPMTSYAKRTGHPQVFDPGGGQYRRAIIQFDTNPMAGA